MGNECEHMDGSLMGKCAVCGRAVCSECYRYVFSEMICDGHEPLEDEAAWELLGLYTDTSAVTQLRFDLEEKEIATIVVAGDEEAMIPEGDSESLVADVEEFLRRSSDRPNDGEPPVG